MLAEGDLVGPNDPADEDCGEGIEGHEGGVDRPFTLDNARVEND